VGKAKDLKKRVSSYFLQKSLLGTKTVAMISQIHEIECIIVESELESLLLEANLIKKYTPKYNIRLTDNKSYPMVRITAKDQYPAVLFARRSEDRHSVYFGPYPSSKTLRTVLRTIRRIFPFHSVTNHPKKECLYHHLGLCPCIPAFNTEENRKAYKKTIKHIIQFMSGEKKSVLKDLEKERDELANNQQFEQCQKIQKQIDAINYVTSPIHRPFEYEINPNLRTDLRAKELNDLRSILGEYGVKTNYLERIECYDISNISGTNAVGSMVVFTNGEKDASQYRRFKITPDIKGPNDFAMMESILTRRLKHDEWPHPDLIVIDGGKGQISSAMNALEKYYSSIPSPLPQPSLTRMREGQVIDSEAQTQEGEGENEDNSSKLKRIPLVGLAKREETIITPDFKEISISKDTEALLLIQRIRDEAHRFAITYHKKLRSKSFLPDEI